jgi:release factor glutamine methyltransferase
MPRESVQRAIALSLAASGIESPSADARILLCAALGIDHAELIREPTCPIGQRAATLESFVARRLKREPVSRIIGRREFWRSHFNLSPAVFDPRPATEALVEAVLDYAALFPRENWRILDLGTGSGAILCSLLQYFPESSGVGVDRSYEACVIAARNCATLGLEHRALIVCGDWTHALRGRFDMIVSNPPYVAQGKFVSLSPEVRGHDPLLALDGGEDGLAAYRKIVPGLCNLLAPEGIVALEVGAGQHLAVESLLRDMVGAPTETKLDLDGHRRVVIHVQDPGQWRDKLVTQIGSDEIFSQKGLGVCGENDYVLFQGWFSLRERSYDWR